MSKLMEDLVFDLYGDPQLKRRFIADPAAVMKERGVTAPEGVNLRAVEDSESIRHIVLPYIAPSEVPSLEEVERRVSKIVG